MVAPLPLGAENTITSDTSGLTLVIKHVSRGSYRLQIKGQRRVRWASTWREVQDDLAHVLTYGVFPLRIGDSWV